MSRSRILTSIAAAALGVAALGACSADSLAERAASFGLEQAIEGNEDIDFDFGDDGSGGFSITTEEGEFSLNFDDENGAITFDTDEGSGVISLDENGIVYDTDEGSGTISIDEDAGQINFDTDQGDGTISFDEDSVVIETEDGDFGIINSADVPDGWPAIIGAPQSLIPGSVVYTEIDLGPEATRLSGTFEHDPNERWAEVLTDRLEANGWNVVVRNLEANEAVVMLQSDDGIVQIVNTAGSTSVSVSLQTA